MLHQLLLSPRFAAFLLASLALALTPGPGVIYIVTRTLSQGRAAGFASVCGIALGNLVNAAAAAFGLAVVIGASAAAFAVVKFGGAAYLIFLGLQALRTRPATADAPPPRRLSPRRLFRAAFMVALLNPKTALFFAALLPQFIEPGAPALAQTLLLGVAFVLIASCTDTLYVVSAAALAANLYRRASWRPLGRYLCAATFMGLGVYAALASARADK